jgi:hypothetical protein
MAHVEEMVAMMLPQEQVTCTSTPDLRTATAVRTRRRRLGGAGRVADGVTDGTN